MYANFVGAKFQRTIAKLRRRKKTSSSFVYILHKKWPKLYDIFLGATSLPSQGGKRFFAFNEFECPRTVLIEKKNTFFFFIYKIEKKIVTLDPRQKDRLARKILNYSLSLLFQCLGLRILSSLPYTVSRR